MTIDKTAQAFAAGRAAKCHNARTDGIAYVLHRSTIAKRITPNIVRFDWSGWFTPTTASHMNAILDALNVRMHVSYAQARDGKADHVFDIQVPA